MAPRGVGAAARAHETFVGPPLDDEVVSPSSNKKKNQRKRSLGKFLLSFLSFLSCLFSRSCYGDSCLEEKEEDHRTSATCRNHHTYTTTN